MEIQTVPSGAIAMPERMWLGSSVGDRELLPTASVVDDNAVVAVSAHHPNPAGSVDGDGVVAVPVTTARGY